ncbi:unnamed protein product, partial [Didymodactylos carnosus]
HLNCEKLIKQYEQKQQECQTTKLITTTNVKSYAEEKEIVPVTTSLTTDSIKDENNFHSSEQSFLFFKMEKDNPFNNGMTRLEKILGLRQVDDKSNRLEFQCKLRGLNRPVWVLNKIVNELYPKDVIQFYQKLLKFDD